MGLDVGTKTVGVAITDELGMTAQALTVVRRTNIKNDLAELQALITEHVVTKLVVGLPLHMNGSEGERTVDARRLGDKLAEHSGLPVIYWDERLTTVAAQRVLLEANLSREKRKKVIDQLAAQFILQGWLDSQPQTQEYDP